MSSSKSSSDCLHTGDYQTHFDTAGYLNLYGGVDIIPDGAPFAKFLITNLTRILKEDFLKGKSKTALEFGGGPSLWPSLLLAQYVDSIKFCDYTQSNLDYVKSWIAEEADGFDWTTFFEAVLEINGTQKDERIKWEKRMRDALQQGGLSRCDVNDPDCPILSGPSETYDIIFSSLCLEAACLTQEIFKQTICRLVRLLKPGGMMVLATVRNDTFYYVSKEKFFCLELDETIIENALKETGSIDDVKIFTMDISKEEQDRNTLSDIDGVMVTRASKKF